MNHLAEFDATNFFLGGEIYIRTNTHTKLQKTTTFVFGDGLISTHAEGKYCR